jgi:hypothetical protein
LRSIDCPKGDIEMRNAILALMILSGGLFASSAVLADAVIIDHPGDVEPVPPPPSHHEVVVEHRHDGDCHSTTVHKENDMGDSKTVTKSDCD